MPHIHQRAVYLDIAKSIDEFKEIQVHTANTFQDFDRPIVFFDLALAKDGTRRFYFVFSDRNAVTTTRHTSSLVIIGDRKCLAADAHLVSADAPLLRSNNDESEIEHDAQESAKQYSDIPNQRFFK